MFRKHLANVERLAAGFVIAAGIDSHEYRWLLISLGLFLLFSRIYGDITDPP